MEQAMEETKGKRTGRLDSPAAWLGKWVLANMAGWVISLVLAQPTIQMVARWHFTMWILAWGVFGAVMGAALGIAQWVILRRQVFRAGRWILASSMGWAAGEAVAMALLVLLLHILEVDTLSTAEGALVVGTEMLAATLGIAVGAVGAGILQWTILRKQFRRAGWWILASTAGVIVALAVGVTVGLPVGMAIVGSVDWLRGGIPVDMAVMGAVIGLVGGLVTAFPLRWVLSHPTAHGSAGKSEIESS